MSFLLSRALAVIAGFARFWYDFIVGDSALLAVGGGLVLTMGYLLVHAGSDVAAEVALPLVAIGAVATSLPRKK
jgi:hypothetical protein